MPTTHMIGAVRITRRNMTMKFCTWVISLLVRVIKDAVENVSISACEKYSTFVKILLLTFRPKPSAILDAKKPVVILHTIPRIAIPSMITPV